MAASTEGIYDLTELAENEFFRLLGLNRPSYKAQWFHGIEHLTIDHEGFVAWRGREIERYTPAWAYTSVARQSALELGRRCRQLEALGVPVDRESAICNWDHHALLPCIPRSDQRRATGCRRRSQHDNHLPG